MEVDLDSKAPVFRVLDFLEEVLLVSASGEPLEASLLATAMRLLEATSDVFGILRSLVSDSDIEGTSKRKCEPEMDSGTESVSEGAAFLAHHPIHRPQGPPSLTRSKGPDRDTRRVRRTQAPGDSGLYGLPPFGVAGGQVLLWP